MEQKTHNTARQRFEAVVHSRAFASTVLVLKAALKSFGANRNLEVAASLAFYGFLSLMPLLLMTIILLGFFVRSSEGVSEAIAAVVSDLIPAFNVEVLNDLNSITAGGTLGIIGLVLLMWSMTPLSGALRSALARMFKMPLQRSFLMSKVIDLTAVLSFLLLFLLLVTINMVVPAATADRSGWLVWLTLTVSSFLPFILSVGFIGLFFRLFSPVTLSWRQWLLGAVCVTVLWTLMRHLFVVFILYNPNYGFAFGSLKAIFLLIVWVYYSFAALLLGAEVMVNTYRRDALLLRGLLDHQSPGHRNDRSLMKKFERTLATGDVLFSEGEVGEEMFVVLEGTVSISKNERELVTMKPGQYFGEMSLLTKAPRSATATAKTPLRIAVITQSNFNLLVRENPVLVRGLLEELARRLAETNRKLNEQVQHG